MRPPRRAWRRAAARPVQKTSDDPLSLSDFDCLCRPLRAVLLCRLQPRFEDEVERGFPGAAEPREAGLAEDLRQPGLAGLRAEHQAARSEEHTSELQSLMRISYAVF